MDYDKIRGMSDKELAIFIEGLKGRSLKTCTKCGAEVRKVIKIENKDSVQTKALCGLCNECYAEILEYLELFDLGWDR